MNLSGGGKSPCNERSVSGSLVLGSLDEEWTCFNFKRGFLACHCLWSRYRAFQGQWMDEIVVWSLFTGA